MTLKDAIDILEKELECRNRLIENEDAEYGVETPCLFECSACEYDTDSTEARDALSLLLYVVKKMEELDDFISRQGAIDAVSRRCFELRGIFQIIKEEIEASPSAQPKQKEPCKFARRRCRLTGGNYIFMERQEAINILTKYLQCRDHYASDACTNLTLCPACEFYVETDILDTAIEILISLLLDANKKMKE